MKAELIYGKSAVVLPASVASRLDKATKRDLKILFALAASPERRENVERSAATIATEVGCTESDVMMSVAFWRGAGIIEIDDRETTEIVEQARPEKQKTERKKKSNLSDELPHYTTAELNTILSAQEEASLLIDESQRAFGKIFNPHEIGILLGLRDYFGFDSEYILILLDHCVRNGKRSLQYVKKRAFSLYDEGITDPVVLHEHLLKLEAAATTEGEIRKLFGIIDREPTTREKKFISKWVGEYAYSVEVIKKAYEMTVDAIQKPAPAYTDAIIERWYAAGLRDIAAIEVAESEKLPVEGSFDTNDFFESALRRSFGETNKSEV